MHLTCSFIGAVEDCFFIIKIILVSIPIIVLVAGTVQGSISYATNSCNNDDNDHYDTSNRCITALEYPDENDSDFVTVIMCYYIIRSWCFLLGKLYIAICLNA